MEHPPLTREQCVEFLANPVRNPLTGAPLRNPNAERAVMIRRMCEYIMRGEPVPAGIMTSTLARSMTARPSQPQATRQQRQQARQVPTTHFIFNEQEIPFNEVAKSLYHYGRGLDNQPYKLKYETYFIRPNTNDLDLFYSKAQTYFPNDWIQHYAHGRRVSMPRYTNPYPQLDLPQPPSIEFKGRLVTYRQVGGIVYSMIDAHRRRVEYQYPRWVCNNMEELGEFITMIQSMFPEDWLLKYIAAGQNNQPIPVYTEPAFVNKKSPQRSPSNNPSSVSSHAPAEEHIAETCRKIFKQVDEKNPFHGTVNKMLKMCKVFVDKCDIQRLNHIKNDINNTKYVQLKQIEEEIPFAEKSFQYIFNGTYHKLPFYSEHFKTFFKNKQNNFNLTYRNQDGIGEGVFRDFIKNCLSAVKNNPAAPNKLKHERVKFFMPIYPGSLRHVVNPAFTVKQAKRLGYKHVKTESDIIRLYNLIGQLFALSARVGAPVPLYLSRTILAHILHKEYVKPYMSLMYFIMDSDPVVSNSTLDLLHNPDHIEYAYIFMNDIYPLVKDDEQVDVKNYVSYIDKYSQYKYLRQFEKDSIDTHARLQAFIDGFYIANDLKKHRVTVRELDKIMCGAPITIESVREWLATDHVSYVVNNQFNQHKQQNVIRWFKEILKDMGNAFPLEVVNAKLIEEKLNSDDSSSKSSDSVNTRLFRSKKKAFLHFFMRLMEFWTSYPKIDMESMYQVRFEREAGFPTSHTCFRQLCLTCEDIDSKETLYRRLITAVFSVEKGIGNI